MAQVKQALSFECFDSCKVFFQALTWLLTVPGASRTVLESRVPYAQSALQEALKFPTSSYASVGTAVDMAKAAYKQAAQLSKIGTSTIGVGCTCALMTDRVKKGDHKACSVHLAVTHACFCACCSIWLYSGSHRHTHYLSKPQVHLAILQHKSLIIHFHIQYTSGSTLFAVEPAWSMHEPISANTGLHNWIVLCSWSKHSSSLPAACI